MRGAYFLLGLASCGRLGFEPGGGDAVRGGSAAVDAVMPDGAGAVVDADQVKACGPAYQAVDGRTSRYRPGGAATSWQLAEQDCERDNGHLPIIDDDAENVWLAAQAIGWIGLSDHRTEGEFVFVTGVPPAYSDWSANEPNNGGQYEDCAAFYFGVQWNDYPCSELMPYVCECDGAAMPSPAVWCVTGTDQDCDRCGDRCPAGTTCGPSQTCIAM